MSNAQSPGSPQPIRPPRRELPVKIVEPDRDTTAANDRSARDAPQGSPGSTDKSVTPGREEQGGAEEGGQGEAPGAATAEFRHQSSLMRGSQPSLRQAARVRECGTNPRERLERGYTN